MTRMEQLVVLVIKKMDFACVKMDFMEKDVIKVKWMYSFFQKVFLHLSIFLTKFIADRYLIIVKLPIRLAH